MHINNVHVLPILSRDNKIVGTFSAKELRGLSVNNIEKLGEAVMEYLKCIDGHQETVAVVDEALQTTNVGDACKMMIEQRVHHVWITSTTSKDIVEGVVTPTDLLRLIFDQP